MRVFYFITKSEQGGAQTVIFELLKKHKERNDFVCVMAEGENWLAQKTKELGFHYKQNDYMVKTYNPLVLFHAALKYRKAIKEFSPDIVSCHSSFSGFVGRFSLLNEYPVVYTAHGWGFTDGTSRVRKIISIIGEKTAGFFCKKIICVSFFDKKNALRYHIVPKNKMVVIQNGVSIENRQTYYEKNKIVEIIFVARFALPKQQMLLLEAFKLLPHSVQEKSHITFVGDGLSKQAVLDYSIEHNLQKFVTFTHSLSRDGALDCMQKSDLFVLLSLWEGLPMSVIEAMQIGLPVVVSDVCGIAEIVDASVGTLVDNKDIDMIAKTLESFIVNVEKREKIGNSARIKGLLFNAERMSNEVFYLYDEIYKNYKHLT